MCATNFFVVLCRGHDGQHGLSQPLEVVVPIKGIRGMISQKLTWENEQSTSLLRQMHDFQDNEEHKSTSLPDDQDGVDGGSILGPLSLARCLQTYCLSNNNCDVIFVVASESGDPEEIPAHRMLLAARSPVFEDMLYPKTEMTDQTLPKRIEIRGTTAATFKLIMKAIYTDKPPIDANSVMTCFAAARKYQVSSLYKSCCEYMAQGLTCFNVCKLYLDSPLEDRCLAMNYIEDYIQKIVVHDPNFIELPESDLISICGSNRLAISEVDLFKGVLKWGRARCSASRMEPNLDNMRKVLSRVIYQIRFPVMSAGELAEVVSPTRILSEDTLVMLFTYIAAKPNVGTVGCFPTHPRNSLGGIMEWDPEKCSGLTVFRDGLALCPTDKECGRNKWCMTTIPFPPHGSHYIEITLNHTQGCFDAIGVVNKKYEHGSRLGETSSSWAIRCHGQHSSKEHYGAIHANEHKDFFRDWSRGDRVGMKYDARAKSLTFYHNGTDLGTPFTNVEGELYPCVEMCHLGVMTANFRAKRPRNPVLR